MIEVPQRVKETYGKMSETLSDPELSKSAEHVRRGRLGGRPKTQLSDKRLKRFLSLTPSIYSAMPQEERHALLKENAELMLLKSTQHILHQEVFLAKSATPNESITWGVRYDKIFAKDTDADTLIVQLPKQALAALQIGLAVQVQPAHAKPLLPSGHAAC